MSTRCRRSWIEWGQSKIVAYSESSLSAVAIVWWASSIVSPMVTKVLHSTYNNSNNARVIFYFLLIIFNLFFLLSISHILSSTLTNILDYILHLIFTVDFLIP